MVSRENKRDIGWGILLITFGIVALLNLFVSISDWMIVLILAGGGLVNLALFLTDRKDWVLLIPAYILLSAALITAIVSLDLLRGTIIAPAVLMLVALPFFVVFLFNPKENWWALIPSWVMVSIGLMVFLLGLNLLPGGVVPLYILGSIALPFLVVFFLNRDNWWALIPAWSLLAIGMMIFLIDTRILLNLAIPAYIMFAIAIPFFVVFLNNRKQNRWALIPGGILGVIGLGFFAGTNLAKYIIPAVLILFGGWVLVSSFTKKE
ncbi:MAG: hypothetical protein JW757_01020 [Anaerolineales bacterium]|nr:hypothetical protein [Anaerolineales bacterium]